MSETPQVIPETRMLIDGKLVESPTGDTFENVNPAGNLCRCTGYQGIVGAVRSLAGRPPRREPHVEVFIER